MLGLAVWVAVPFLLGCTPPLPEPSEILRGLSRTILQPNVSCAELREAFGLDELPLVDTPDEIGIGYEELHIDTASGEKLRVWYMSVDDSPGTVVVSPGNTGPMSCYLFTGYLLVQCGWSVVMYDYEGFGGSTGVPALTRLRDDLDSVVNWTLQRTGQEQVVLFGMSLGSIPSVAVATQRPREVSGVILDSPVALATEIERFNFLIRGRAAEVIGSIAQLAPWLLTELTVGHLRQPVLIFLHEYDLVSPPATVRILFEQAVGPKELVVFEGLDHAAGQFERTEQYQARLAAFLDSLVRQERD